MNLRNLTEEEVKELKARGCHAVDWSEIWISDPFFPERFQDVQFSGRVQIGIQEGKIEVFPGVFLPTGIFRAHIQNSTIGNNVYIADVGLLANYIIESGVVIHHVGECSASGSSFFGQGTEVSVLNEAGGRVVRIFDQMSAQMAYMLTIYRHDTTFIEKANRLIASYIQDQSGATGRIAEGARIVHCRILRNLMVGKAAVLEGAAYLEDGTILSQPEVKTKVINGVTARHFILQSGAQVEDGVFLERCFVGQGVQIGRQFSAENTLFFANSEAFQGEASSVFAGPFTVTHHKSTLLIAGLFSFFNAGSGSNQSNHLYKLGPVHQGIVERGSKTGSFSYLLWPSHIGAYSIIIGKHAAHLDTSCFPFSYILESDGGTVLVPGINFYSIGTQRDIRKWPLRDKRGGQNVLDLIVYDWLTPRIINQVLKGMAILRNLKDTKSSSNKWIRWKDVRIPASKIDFALETYQHIVNLFIGERILQRVKFKKNGEQGLKGSFWQPEVAGHRWKEWVDLAGLVAPLFEVRQLMDDIKAGAIDNIYAWQERLHALYQTYSEKAWLYTIPLIEERSGKKIVDWEPTIFLRLLEEYQQSLDALYDGILRDAKKEFDEQRKFTYGLDGEPEIRELDFQQVRGTLESNATLKAVKTAHQEKKEAIRTAAEFLRKL